MNKSLDEVGDANTENYVQVFRNISSYTFSSHCPIFFLSLLIRIIEFLDDIHAGLNVMRACWLGEIPAETMDKLSVSHDKARLSLSLCPLRG